LPEVTTVVGELPLDLHGLLELRLDGLGLRLDDDAGDGQVGPGEWIEASLAAGRGSRSRAEAGTIPQSQRE
jgi:hypothetical protein